MQNQGRRGRFKSLKSKRKGSQSAQSQSSQANNNDYNDQQRVIIRYDEAVSQLKEAIKIRKGVWSSFDFDELPSEPGGFNDSQFQNKINAVLISQETSIKDKKGWSKFTHAVECVFMAFSPFAKNFLSNARNAQSVIVI